jgi:hypothetical protein
MKYYVVLCKFGHVGRNKYLPLNIPVIAVSKKEASLKAKSFRGIKKNHKDWCLEEPKEVTFEFYQKERIIFKNDIYFQKKTRSRLSLFSDRLVDEKSYIRINDIKTNTKTYIKTKDVHLIEFKLKKLKVVMDALSDECNYYIKFKGDYQYGINA